MEASNEVVNGVKQRAPRSDSASVSPSCSHCPHPREMHTAEREGACNDCSCRGYQPKRALRSDKGTRRKKPENKKAASALLEVVATLQALATEDVARVLSAAAIFLNVANFDKAEK